MNRTGAEFGLFQAVLDGDSGSIPFYKKRGCCKQISLIIQNITNFYPAYDDCFIGEILN